MTKCEQVLFCEFARWGDMDALQPADPAVPNQTAKPALMTKTDPGYLVGKPYGDWDRNTSYIINQWLPQRRTYYLDRLQSAGLYQP